MRSMTVGSDVHISALRDFRAGGAGAVCVKWIPTVPRASAAAWVSIVIQDWRGSVDVASEISRASVLSWLCCLNC